MPYLSRRYLRLALFLAVLSLGIGQAQADNRLCDEATIAQLDAERVSTEAHWNALRLQYFGTGEGETPPAPGDELIIDSVTGCIIDPQDLTPEQIDQLDLDRFMEDLTVMQSDRDEVLTQAPEMETHPDEAKQDQGNTKAASLTNQEEEFEPEATSGTRLFIDWSTVLIVAIILSCLSFVIREAYKFFRGKMLKRHTCKIPAKLAFEYGEFPGYITILGIRGFRFSLISSFQADALADLLSRPEILEFDVIIEETILPVALDPVKGGTLPVFFIYNLRAEQLYDLLSISLTKPAFSAYIPVPENTEFRNRIIRERRAKIEKSLAHSPTTQSTAQSGKPKPAH